MGACLPIAALTAGLTALCYAELAARIGSAREVISRRLDHFAKSGWVLPQRGQITILDPRALRRLDAALAGM